MNLGSISIHRALGIISILTTVLVGTAAQAASYSTDEIKFGSPIYGDYPGVEYRSQSIASNGRTMLAAWLDHTDARDILYGTHLDLNGVPIEAGPFQIGRGRSMDRLCTVATDGTDYLVVWTEVIFRREQLRWLILAEVVRADGVRSGPFEVDELRLEGKLFTALSAGPGRFAFFWYDDAQPILQLRALTPSAPAFSRIKAAFIDTTSEPFVFKTEEVAAGSYNSFNGWDVCARRGEYWIFWGQSRSLKEGFAFWTRRFDAEGAALDESPLLLVRNPINQTWWMEMSFEAAASDDDILLAWSDRGSPALRYVRFAAEPFQPPFSPTISELERPRLYDLLGLDDRFLVLTDVHGGLQLIEVYPTGELVALGPIPSTRPAYRPRLTRVNERVFMAWSRTEADRSKIVGTFFDRETPELAGTDVRLISRTASSQEHPGIAHGTNGLMIVWSDNRHYAESGWDIYGARLSENFELMDPEGFPISQAAGDQTLPVIASNGEVFGVAWQDAGDGSVPARIVVGGIRADGTWIEPGLFSPVTHRGISQQRPSASAATDGTFLIGWHEEGQVYAARIRGEPMTVLDPAGMALSGLERNVDRIQTAAAADSFGVAWKNSSGVRFVRISNGVPQAALVTVSNCCLRLAGLAARENDFVLAGIGGITLMQAWVQRIDNGMSFESPEWLPGIYGIPKRGGSVRNPPLDTAISRTRRGYALAYHEASDAASPIRVLSLDGDANLAAWQPDSAIAVSIGEAFLGPSHLALTGTESETVAVFDRFAEAGARRLRLVRIPQWLRRPPPTATTVRLGDGVQLAAVLETEGAGDFTFQWFFQGEPIPGANDVTFSFDAESPEQAGKYALQISSPSGATIEFATIVTLLTIDAASGVLIYGPQGTTYQIQTRPDLKTGHWRTETTLRLTTNPTLWNPFANIGSDRGFYRIIPL